MPSKQKNQRKLRYLVVNAFVREEALTSGNPAAIVLLPPSEDQLDERTMQALAAQMNLSETAFVYWTDETMKSTTIRWFTPRFEVDLCGHATLAATAALHAYVKTPDVLKLQTLCAGELSVKALPDGDIGMDFPVDIPNESVNEQDVEAVIKALGLPPGTGRVRKSKHDVVVELEDERAVAVVKPDMRALSALNTRGVSVCARGDNGTAFVARFFAPGHGIDEDPVTGSMMCYLAPLFLEDGAPPRLVRQISEREGWVRVAWRGERVKLSGKAAVIAEGHVYV